MYLKYLFYRVMAEHININHINRLQYYIVN